MERNIELEKKNLAELMKTGQYKLDEQGKNPELEKAVNQKSYSVSRPTFKSQYGLDKIEKEMDEATSAYESREANQGNRANYYEKSLKEKLPWLGADREKLQKQYSNIEDPFAREKLVQEGMDTGRTSLGEMMNRMMGVYQTKTAEQQSGMNELDRKYQRALQNYQEAQGENERLDQQDAQQAMMQMQGGGGRSSGGSRRSSGGGRYTSSYGAPDQAMGEMGGGEDILQKIKNREMTREEYGQMLAEANPNASYDEIMRDIYAEIPDEALQGVDVGGQILPEEQAGRYQQVQEAGQKAKTFDYLPGTTPGFEQAKKYSPSSMIKKGATKLWDKVWHGK